MKRFTKKTISVVLALTLVIGMCTATFGDVKYKFWTTYFAVNENLDPAHSYEGAESLSFKETNNSFTANMSKLGWQGVWGGQVKKKISVTKGKQYVISFKAKSSKINKYIYVKVGSDDALAYSFWVKLPAGKNVTVTKSFKAAATNNEFVTFGIGGELVNRSGMDKDADVRYAAFKRDFKKDPKILEKEDCTPGDAASPTVISVTNYSLDKAPGKVSVKKAKALGKKKVKVTWKKMAGAKKYEVMVGKAKKTTTKTSIKMKAKKKGKQAVKVRAIAGTYKAPWSKAKKVKVK